MITLLGALLGFIGSLVPEIFKMLKSKQDNAQELAVLDRQMEMQKLGNQQRLEEIGIQADSAALIAAYNYNPKSGNKKVDALAGSVRPVVTYCFFIAYIIVKTAQYNSLTHIEMLPWMDGAQKAQQWFTIIQSLWSEEDQALFAAVMTFWFGDRSLTNNRRARR